MADQDPAPDSPPANNCEDEVTSDKNEVPPVTKRKRDVDGEEDEPEVAKRLCKGDVDLPVDEDSQSSGTIPDPDLTKEKVEEKNVEDSDLTENMENATESNKPDEKVEVSQPDSESIEVDKASNVASSAEEGKDSVLKEETVSKSEQSETKKEKDSSSKDSDTEKPADVDNSDFTSKTDKSVVSDEDAMNLSQKSGDSDKENIDCPMDLSTKATNSPDIIMLSDEDIEDGTPKINGHITVVNGGMTPERGYIVRCLKENLRNEEAKLVLLKKIRQSQMMQHLTETSQQVNKQPSTRPPQSAPPPLVRGGQTSAHSKSSNMPPQLMPRNLSGQNSHMRSSSQGPPPLVMAPRPQQNSNHPSIRGNQNERQPPSLIPGGYRQVQSQAPAPQPPQQPEQTPAQRQAAAKLALRKQLEKTLLQIPPPKPPPPEMNFIPSLLGNEFILLVGLEEVVKFITDTDARTKGDKAMEVKYVFNPFVCVQCGTDFTPVWKRDKPGSKSVICEQCVTTNQKKALKQEHTNRLKSAFVKALQQEQEIEQRMQQSSSQSGGSSSSNTTTSSNNATSSSSSSNNNSSGGSSSSHSNHSSHANHSSHSNHGSHHPMAGIPGASVTSPMNLSTMKPTTEQIRQHQNLIQAHQAQLRSAHALSGLQFAPRGLPFPFTPPNLSASKAADLQRQYLLDMIPPRSMPQGTVLWKS